MTAQQLEDIKVIEIDLLRHFMKVCEKLGLKYYMIGGTLLGAVRHQGFIPWDDDIDVGMPRADYEVLLAEGQKFLPDGIFLQSSRNDKEFYANFAKIRNSSTTFVEKSVKHCNMNHGVYIDIFPLDGYPNKKGAQKKFKFINRLYSRRISSEFYFEGENGIKRKIISAILNIMYPSVTKVVQKRERLFTAVTCKDNLANYSSAYGLKEIVPAEWYGEGVMLNFEGMSVCAPNEYEKWLTKIYGNYMELPPEDKRNPHHYVHIVDFEKPYTYYQNIAE